MTIDHDEIRNWAEARCGRPSMVTGTGEGGHPGILRIDFPGYSGRGTLEPISWDEFFEKFEESNLALVLSEHAHGHRSNFNKLIARESVDLETGEKVGLSRHRRKQAEQAATPRRATAKKAGARKATPLRASRSATAERGERRAPRSAAARTARGTSRKTTGKTTGRGSQRGGARQSPERRGSSRGGKSRSR
ncbi:MAG: hypothetical protein ACXU86_06915 [Archangium sp.]